MSNLVLQVLCGELVGTMLLIILGNGVVHNVIGKKTKGSQSGWIVVAFGWGMAVLMGALVSNAIGAAFSNATTTTVANTYNLFNGNLNPAVSIAQLMYSLFGKSWNIGNEVMLFSVAVGAQCLGAFIGQCVVNLVYANSMRELGTASLGAHATGPIDRKNSRFVNSWSEFVATAVLILVVIFALNAKNAGGSMGINYASIGMGSLYAALTVLGIGLSLGGTTGYAINPARDAIPRLTYMMFHKIWKFKGSAVQTADWAYGWIPIVFPMVAGIVVGLIGGVAISH